MTLKSDVELANTRKKLQLLEERVALVKSRPVTNAHVRQLTLQSLMSMVNQLREEIARYQAGAGARAAE